MSVSSFYEEQRESSRAKTEIVSKYFQAWARIVLRHAKRRQQNVGFVDLFAGPGIYRDGTYSTPLEVLEIALENEDLTEYLECHFNDKDPSNVIALRDAISQFTGAGRLRHQPLVTNIEVTRELIPVIERAGERPTFFFVDPWGYKGLSIDLFRAAIQGWGCDLMFFFNYNRINPAIDNRLVDERINDLFGEERARELRKKLARLSGHEREMTIVNEMSMAIRENGGGWVLPFTFRNERGNRTSHQLIFVSKNFTGFDIMKDIMANVGTAEGLESVRLTYNPASDAQLSFLTGFENDMRLELLEGWLLDFFRGRTVRVGALIEEHERALNGTAFTTANYREAIRRLERNRLVTLDRGPDQRPKLHGVTTVGDDRTVYFLNG